MFERHFDIVVAGGGVAGIAAAVAAGRRGMKTVLLEKTVLPGGLATAGLIYIYLPLCDGNGTQVSFGITEEMLRRSIQYGPGEIPPGWRSAKNAPEAERFRVVFSPASFILGLDEMLEEANVEVWYDTVVTGTVLEGERLAKVAVSNKSGSGMLSASCFVDATGDADLAALSGLPCIEGKNALACWTLEYREGKGNLAGDCALAMLGFLVTGIGMGPVYPSIQHMAPEHFGRTYSAAVIGLQMASAYVGTCFMPSVFGLVANHISVSLFPVYLAVILILMVLMHERMLRKRESGSR